MNKQEENFVNNVLKLTQMIQLMDFADPVRAQKIRQESQPVIDAAMDLTLKLLREGHIILGCQLQLATLPEEQRGKLSREVAHLLKASCWDERDRIKCALTWARNRIRNEDIPERDLAETVSLWPTDEASIEYGMICLGKAVSQGKIKVEIR